MAHRLTEHHMLPLVERLLAIPGANVVTTLEHAADLVASALSADKVDAFLYDATRDTLVALGTSDQPLSALQKKHGLDVLPIANGGNAVAAFQSGKTTVTGRLDEDEDELLGLKETLGIRSQIGVPLEVGGQVRGVMMIASQQPDFFNDADVRFAEAISRWVGVVAHRAELVQEIERNAIEQGRRAVAEELVMVLAHDMKNYLSPLHIRLDLLRRRAGQEERATDVHDIDLALKSLAGLERLVSDLLDVARIDTGLFDLDARPLDVRALVDDLASTLATPEIPVRVRASEQVISLADPERVRQCLQNLLANAIKHSPRNGAITVMVSRQRREQGMFAHVEIIDEGPGVPPEIAPRVFERFVRGKREHGGGLGLGLYLAKRIAVMHGGDVTLSSSARGSRFTLTLPCE